MSETRRRRALVSVFDKAGVVDFCRGLAALGFEVLSTGGTASALTGAGIAVTPVDEITGFPEVFDGRVKTLHPKIHGGILFRRDRPEHVKQAREHGIEPIDLVVINLYPFADTAARPDAGEDEIIEMIDIGGPALLRAAAKNHAGVTVVVEPADYTAVLAELQEHGQVADATRKRLAGRAFQHSARYDQQVSRWFRSSGVVAGENAHPDPFVLQVHAVSPLRYGENPHQRATLYRETAEVAGSVVGAHVVQGKQLSFNNYLDLDSAWSLAAEFAEVPAAVVVKHNNPCGVATAPKLAHAYAAARDADSQSAYGGVVALNQPVDGPTAREIASTFIEAVFAPGYEEEALQILSRRKNLRLLDSGGVHPGARQPALDFRRISGGLLVQDPDIEPQATEWKVVSSRAPGPDEEAALEFAWKVVKHVRSNAIVYAAANRTLGIGAGQMSRVDAARIGAQKAAENTLQGAALASDAFFPFRDSVDQAAEAGIKAIIQPGGSIRDAEVIEAANAADIAMVFTGVRHFRH